MDQTKYQTARSLQLRIDSIQELISKLPEVKTITLGLGKNCLLDIPNVLRELTVGGIKAALVQQLKAMKKEFKTL